MRTRAPRAAAKTQKQPSEPAPPVATPGYFSASPHSRARDHPSARARAAKNQPLTSPNHQQPKRLRPRAASQNQK